MCARGSAPNGYTLALWIGVVKTRFRRNLRRLNQSDWRDIAHLSKANIDHL